MHSCCMLELAIQAGLKSCLDAVIDTRHHTTEDSAQACFSQLAHAGADCLSLRDYWTHIGLLMLIMCKGMSATGACPCCDRHVQDRTH